MKNPIRYGLDIDNVLADFVTQFLLWAYTHGYDCFVKSADLVEDYTLGATQELFQEAFDKFKHITNFWHDIEPLAGAVEAVNNLPIKPTAYITCRPMPNAITETWLQQCGFPNAPVYTVDTAPEKLQIIKDLGLDYFIDDLPTTVQQLNENGVIAFLLSQPHNRHSDVLPRISSLNELSQFLTDVELVEDRQYLNSLRCICGYAHNKNAPCFTPADKKAVATVSPANLENGYKADAGKPRFDLLPYEALEEVARVYTFGANKYDDNNWRKGMRYGRVFAATMRHLAAFIMGFDRDEESGLLHIAHAAFGCLTLCSYQLTKIGDDDRFKLTKLER